MPKYLIHEHAKGCTMCKTLRTTGVSVLAGQSSTLFSYKGLTPNILFGFCCGIIKHKNPIVAKG